LPPADAKLNDYLRRLDAGDDEESSTGGARVKNLAEKIVALRQKRTEYGAFIPRLHADRDS
jgi:hypothetical protein